MEIRKLTTNAERLQAEEINSLVFYFPLPEEEKGEEDPGLSIWGALEGDKVISTIFVPEYTMNYHGSYLPMFGIGGVGTRAEARNRGYIRKLFYAIFDEMKERNYAFSYLYPFSFAYYAKFGYSYAICRMDTTLPTSLLAECPCTFEASLYEKGDSHEPYAKVYDAFAKTYTGMVARPDWKRLKDYDAVKKQKFLYLLRKDGEPRAYLVYTVKRDEHGDQKATVQDFAWTDVEAMREVFGFLGAQRSHLKAVHLHTPECLPVTRLFSNPYDVEMQANPFGQVRIIDLKKALEGYPWPKEEGEVQIEVRDDYFADNTGVFTVRFGPGGCKVEKGGHSPQLELDIRAANPLLFGSISFDDLAFLPAEQVTVHSGEELLRKIFTRRPTLIADYF